MRLAILLVLATAQIAWSITNTSPDYDTQRVIPGHSYQGITFRPNGDLVTSSGSSFCLFANAANLPRGSTLSVAANARCGTSNVGATNIVSSKTGRIYTVNGHEIDVNTWVGTRRWNDCGASHGIAVDPRDGAIFVSSVNTGKVWRIPDPDQVSGVINVNCASALYFDGGAVGVGGFDGITIGPDGTFYGAGWTAGRFILVSPWTAQNPVGTLVASKPTIARSPDGISICVSNGNNFAIVAMTSGSISRFALSGPGGAPQYQETTIATNVGGYLDFTAVDPKGCIWGTVLSSTAGMYRIMNADGSCGCASAQVPTGPCNPSSGQCLSLSALLALQH